jgi:3-oxoacyl-[acyl-carrier-protein] synthase III
MLEAPLRTVERPQPERSLRPAAIGAVGMAVPARIVDNDRIAARLGIEPGWIVERTGVLERRVLGDGETLLGLAAEAAGATLERAALEPSALDQVLVATMSHDRLTPNLAPLLAEEIGASGAGALDVGAACTGFVGALAMAVAQVETHRAENVLVVGAERLSTMTDHDDRATAALFGDGAGAVLVRAADGAGFGPFVLGSDGARAEVVTVERSEALIRMRGQDTFREAVNRMAEATLAATTAAGRTLADIDLFVYHQANARILAAVGERLGLERERVIDCIDRFGNTSSATLPIALAEAKRLGKLEHGSTVLLGAFGAGFTWGAGVIEWAP